MSQPRSDRERRLIRLLVIMVIVCVFVSVPVSQVLYGNADLTAGTAFLGLGLGWLVNLYLNIRHHRLLNLPLMGEVRREERPWAYWTAVVVLGAAPGLAFIAIGVLATCGLMR